jgi:orotidine-5'-phosphate decarboxylase
MNRNPVIVALDVESRAEARALVGAIGPAVEFYKVGMELYAAAGPDMVRELKDCGKQVFLDLKFYDIPETVRRAVAQVARLGVRFLTVHAVESVMRAAVEGKGSSGLQLLAVTVLTSFGPEDLAGLGYTCPASELVALRAKQAVAARVDGIVCSPLEVAAVRAIAGPPVVLVTPGVRSPGAAHGDQKRVATPAEAMRNGADYLVIGRQITRSTDPAGEAARVLHEIHVGHASASPPPQPE